MPRSIRSVRSWDLRNRSGCFRSVGSEPRRKSHLFQGGCFMHLVPLILLVLEGAVPFPNPMAGALPRAPRSMGKTVDLFRVDLAKVPEVDFQEPLSGPP